MDQSDRHVDLNLKEADPIAGGRHVLVAYIMEPKAGHGFLETAAHFAAESSTGANVELSTTDDFTRGADALVHAIDEAKELGMNPTTPIIPGGRNALRMPGFFAKLGHSDLILTAGGGAFGHIDGAAAGATSLRQAEQCREEGADPLEFAKEHKEFARAFESFAHDADALYPDCRMALRIHSVA